MAELTVDKDIIEKRSIDEFTRLPVLRSGQSSRGLGFDKPLIDYHPQKSSVSKDASHRKLWPFRLHRHFCLGGSKIRFDLYLFSNRVYQTRENRKIYELNVRPLIHQVIYDSFLEN